MKILNLLPKEEVKELQYEQYGSQIFRFWTSTVLALIVLFVISLAGNFWLSQKISINNSEIENKKQELSTAATKQLEQEVSELNAQIRLIDSLRRNHYYWSNALIELSYLLDTDAKFTSVQMDRETGKVQVNGEAGDRDSVLAFWAAVKKSEMYKNIDFPLTNLEKDEGAEYTFTFFINPEKVKQE